MNTNKKGFTLIELLVVIVIIGILATISVATFGGYFKKARDAERQTMVSNISTIMKLAGASTDTANYEYTAPEFKTLLEDQGLSLPKAKGDYDYVIWARDDNFAVAVCKEEVPTSGSTVFIAGTPDGVADVDTAHCSATVFVPALIASPTTLKAGSAGDDLVTTTCTDTNATASGGSTVAGTCEAVVTAGS